MATHRCAGFNEVSLTRDGPEKFKAAVDRYVEKHSSKVKQDAQVLIARGVKPERIVYISRNKDIGNTLGACYYTYEDFVANALKMFTGDTFPAEGYELESLAVDGDDFELMKVLLKDAWRTYAGEWEEFTEHMTASRKIQSDVANSATGVANLHIAY